MENYREFIKSTQSLGKDESYEMLQQECKVKEAEVLNGIESLIEAFSSWSDNFKDVCDLFEILKNGILII